MGDQKKLAFYEIGQGSLFRDFQAEFEQAQITAREQNDTVVVILKIAVLPPEISDGRFGHCKYSVDTKNPSKKSVVYTTELKDGIIVNDGEDMADILQTTLELPETIHLTKKES
jgi:hypothetical protein